MPAHLKIGSIPVGLEGHRLVPRDLNIELNGTPLDTLTEFHLHYVKGKPIEVELKMLLNSINEDISLGAGNEESLPFSIEQPLGASHFSRPYGMSQLAYDAYIKACFVANVDPNRVMQTIGNAVASAGFHAKDGVDPLGHDYCAATDIRSKDLNKDQIGKLVNALSSNGICAFWRHTGSFANNQHIHFVYVGIKMKRQLQAQVHDFINGRDGLVGHGKLTDFPPDAQQQQALRTLFLAHNPLPQGVATPIFKPDTGYENPYGDFEDTEVDCAKDNTMLVLTREDDNGN